MKRDTAPLIIFALILLITTCLKPIDAAETVSLTKDIVYGNIDGRELKLDLALPADDNANGAAILIIHGGGWRSGDKSSHVGQARAMAESGYVSATVGYRLVPEARFPAQVDDVRCAVRYLRSRGEELNLDSNRFGAIGFSAGAHLAMMLGVVDDRDSFEDVGGHPGLSSKVTAVVSYFGPTELDAAEVPPEVGKLLVGFLGGTKEESPEVYKAASPINYVDSQDAEMLLFQGTRDPLVPFDQAVRMADKLTRENVAGRVELLLGMSHGWSGETLEHTTSETLKFFNQQLLEPEAVSP